MILHRPQKKKQSNRPEKGGDLSVAFPAPPAPFRAAHFSPSALRRAVAGRTARLHQRFAKYSWRLASMFLFEICSNFVVEAAPNEKSWFLARNFEAVFQVASHLLPREPEVRLRGAQSSAQWYDYFTIATEQPIFCISPKAKLLNFQKESDNFPREARLCPKAITT